MNADIDKTKNLPIRIVWRDALKSLEVGEYFEVSKIKRASIANQITFLKKNIGLEFKTQTSSENNFKVIRIK